MEHTRIKIMDLRAYVREFWIGYGWIYIYAFNQDHILHNAQLHMELNIENNKMYALECVCV